MKFMNHIGFVIAGALISGLMVYLYALRVVEPGALLKDKIVLSIWAVFAVAWTTVLSFRLYRRLRSDR